MLTKTNTNNDAHKLMSKDQPIACKWAWASVPRAAALRHSTSSFRALRVKEVCNSKRQHAALLLYAAVHAAALRESALASTGSSPR